MGMELAGIENHPLIAMDPEQLETVAAGFATMATTIRDNGEDIVTKWAPISTHYAGPGDAQLFAVMTPVKTTSKTIGDGLDTAANAIRAFKVIADQIKTKMDQLKLDHAALKTATDGWDETDGERSVSRMGTITYKDDHWSDDEGLKDENLRIIRELSSCLEQMHEAERICINAIRDIHSLPPLASGDGGYENGEYGVGDIPDEAETPWGTGSYDDESCGSSALGAAGTFFVDLTEITNLVGFSWGWGDKEFGFSGDVLGDTWGGIGMLVGRDPESGDFSWGTAGSTWAETGKGIVAWDRWGENPGGAGGEASVNVLSSFIPGVGILGKASKLARAGKGDVDVPNARADYDLSTLDGGGGGRSNTPDPTGDLDFDFDFDSSIDDLPRTDVDTRPGGDHDGPSGPPPRGDGDADRNDGVRNDNDRNDGDRNDGGRNDGDRNDGGRNDNDRNDDDRNDGDRNDGDRNDGDRNDGDRNDGDRGDGGDRDPGGNPPDGNDPDTDRPGGDGPDTGSPDPADQPGLNPPEPGQKPDGWPDGSQATDPVTSNSGTHFEPDQIERHNSIASGDVNPELRGTTFHPDTRYELDGGRYVFETDAQGRVVYAEGTLDHVVDVPDDYRVSGDQANAGGADRVRDGNSGDAGGHFFAARFGGPGEGINLTAQNHPLVNNGQYAALERIWAEEIRAGNTVEVRVETDYPGSSLRPAEYSVTYRVEGGEWQQPDPISNPVPAAR